MEMKLDHIKLKQLREARAWSQAHLAEVSGISLRTIQRIEKSGVASPESVKSLCATLEVKLDELLIHQKTKPESAPTFSTALACKLSQMNKSATLISFTLAFAIAYLLSQ